MKSVNPEKLGQKLEESGYDRIEFTPHFYHRARRRNIDAETAKRKLGEHEFVEVRENNQSDPKFDHSYKVTIKAEDGRYEMPIYFNVPGPKLIVKSIWPR
ncbi:MAG: hypothetical protein ABEK16_00395 [Candidatus Nanohalobium sp.]